MPKNCGNFLAKMKYTFLAEQKGNIGGVKDLRAINIKLKWNNQHSANAVTQVAKYTYVCTEERIKNATCIAWLHQSYWTLRI